MKVWIPATLAGVIVAAYAYFYFVEASAAQGATALGAANFVGLAAVFVGLIAAGVLLRRAAPAN